MKRLFEISLALAAALFMGACQSLPDAPPARAALRIAHVTVIDPETRRLLPDRTVYVEGERIVAVVPARGRQPFEAARTVDGSGRFLIPGLVDMHVHLFLPQPTELSLNLFLANGVTGVREMSGDCWEPLREHFACIEEYRRLQARIQAGEVPGPEIVAVASAMVMGPAGWRLEEPASEPIVPSTPDEARRLVRYLKERGVDLIKTNDSIPLDVFRALAEEARTVGLEVSGHVPYGADLAELARLRFGTIEHARDLLYDCSRYGAQFRREGGAFADRVPGARRPDTAVRLARTVSDYDADLCRARLAALAASGIRYVPTHLTREMDARAGDAAYRNDPRRRFLTRARNAAWDEDLDETARAGRSALFEGFFVHGLAITGLAHRAGVPIMAGTDANDTMVVPGFSLHDELAILVRAGLSPMDALRAATVVPAAYLRRSATLGGIAAGREADLVLLDANPLDDVANSRRIHAVIADGRLYDRTALDALLAAAERVAAATR